MFLARWTRICHLAETRPTYRTCIGLMRRMHRCNRVLRQIRQIWCRSHLFRHRAEARSLHRMLMRRMHHRHLAVTRFRHQSLYACVKHWRDDWEKDSHGCEKMSREMFQDAIFECVPPLLDARLATHDESHHRSARACRPRLAP